MDRPSSPVYHRQPIPQSPRQLLLMVAVFQLDLAILASVLSGELRLRLLVPYTVIAIIPAMAGIIGGKYLGNVANMSLVIAVCYVGMVLLAFYGTGQLRLLPPPGTIFVSPGDLVPPLVFIVLAIVAYRLRRFAAARTMLQFLSVNFLANWLVFRIRRIPCTTEVLPRT